MEAGSETVGITPGFAQSIHGLLSLLVVMLHMAADGSVYIPLQQSLNK